MAFPFLILGAILFGFVGLMLLMPKPKVENARPQQLSDLNFPTSSEGSPVPVVLGTVRHRGPNTIGLGGFRSKAIKKKVKTGLFSSKKVTVGYKYYITLDLGLCLGPDVHLKRIWFDKDEVWSGDVGPAPTAISINKPKLWGGEEKGGGFVGTLRFYGGQFTQAANAAMAAIVAPDEYPGYVGQAHIVLEDCYIGTQAQLRAMSFELSRHTNGLGLTGGHNIVGDDLNPSEMVYQLLTLDWGGLDVDQNDIDLPSFVADGETLFTESNGMSLIISSANSGKDAIEEVLRQTDGIMYQDPVSGKIISSLIRQDYDVEDLLVLDKSNVSSVRSFSRTSWDDTINQVRVTYLNRSNKYEKGIATVQDLANINSQGRIRSTNISFPGVTDGTLASQLASREMAQLSVPLFRATLEVNREAGSLRPGQPFIWSWEEFQIEQVVMRVQRFNLGDLIDGRIVIDCVQDEHALDQTIFAPPEGTGHVPSTDIVADPVTSRLVKESPYFLASAAGMAVALTQSVVLVAADLPAGADSFDVYTSSDGGTTYARSADAVVPSAIAVLDTAITGTSNLATGVIASIDVLLDDASDLEAHTAAEVAQGAGMMLIDGELMAYEGKAVAGSTVTLSNVWRSLLDTSPGAHALGAKVYFLDGGNVIEDLFPADATVRVKLATNTVDDTMDYTTDAASVLVLHSRPSRPLPPAAIKFGAGAINAPPANGASPVTVTWANRDRLSQTVRKIADVASEYEDGQQTTIRWRVNAGAWTSLTYAPGVGTAEIDTGSIAGDTVDWEFYATRDGLDSYAKWQFTSGAAAPTGSSPETSVGGGSGAPSTPADGTPGYSTPNGISFVFPFGETIGTYPIDIPITFAVTVPAGLTGTNVDHDDDPTADATFTLEKNGVPVADVEISAAGAYTLTAAAAFTLAPGDSFSCVPPAPADATLTGVSITVAATRNG